MGFFITYLDFSFQRDKWILDEPFVYCSYLTDKLISIPKYEEIVFDKINFLPKFINMLIDEKMYRAITIRNFLYLKGYFDRKTTDKIFYEVMQDCDVPWIKRKFFYRLSRIFGKNYFHDYWGKNE